MVDITFKVLENEYRLTSDDRQYIIQQCTGVSGENSKTPGEKTYAAPHYFVDLGCVFSYIASSYPRTSDRVISSLVELERVQRAVSELSDQLRMEFEQRFGK